MIIIEGIDGTGKTTLVNDLLGKNYKLVKQDFNNASHYNKYVNIIKSSNPLFFIRFSAIIIAFLVSFIFFIFAENFLLWLLKR